jgi:teichoic acid transport system ATP-binding protein
MRIIECQNLGVKYKLAIKRNSRKPIIRALDRIFKKSYIIWALKGISFSVDKGDVLGVIGNSGSGKSTLLQAIAGMSSPDEGSISVRGTVSGLLTSTTGFKTGLSGLENIYLYGKQTGLKKSDVEKLLSRIVSLADVGEFIDRPVRMYSRDMSARLGFSITTNFKRDIMLIDEALEAGDSEFQQKSTELIEELLAEKQTMIIVSHHMETIRKFANKVIWLEDGSMVAQGEPEKITVMYRT